MSAKIKANQKYLKLIQIADDWAEVKAEDKIKLIQLQTQDDLSEWEQAAVFVNDVNQSSVLRLTATPSETSEFHPAIAWFRNRLNFGLPKIETERGILKLSVKYHKVRLI